MNLPGQDRHLNAAHGVWNKILHSEEQQTQTAPKDLQDFIQSSVHFPATYHEFR